MAKNRRFEPITRWILPTFEETGIDLRGENATSFNIVVFTRVKVGGRGGRGGRRREGRGREGKALKLKLMDCSIAASEIIWKVMDLVIYHGLT